MFNIVIKCYRILRPHEIKTSEKADKFWNLLLNLLVTFHNVSRKSDTTTPHLLINYLVSEPNEKYTIMDVLNCVLILDINHKSSASLVNHHSMLISITPEMYKKCKQQIIAISKLLVKMHNDYKNRKSISYINSEYDKAEAEEVNHYLNEDPRYGYTAENDHDLADIHIKKLNLIELERRFEIGMFNCRSNIKKLETELLQLSHSTI